MTDLVAVHLADDESPGNAVGPGDPLNGSRARFGVLRVNRDLFREATVGVLLTDREYGRGHNRVGSADARFKLSPNWVAMLHAASSWTRALDGSSATGQAYSGQLRREGRHFTQSTEYLDVSPGFATQAGFVSRTDIRSVAQELKYLFRPRGETLFAWGPSLGGSAIWDHDGTRLDWEVEAGINWELRRQTTIGVFYRPGRERLRPDDHPELSKSHDFATREYGVSFNSQYVSALTFTSAFTTGRAINLVPVAGAPPVLANSAEASLGFTARPNRHLSSDNTYVLSRLTGIGGGGRVFTNHILRSRWNWQFNPQLALRVILQYDTLLANPSMTRLETRKNFNADFLFTYLVNPWTALHVGYNGNLQNIALRPTDFGRRVVRADGMYHDARQVFVKVSYLFQF